MNAELEALRDVVARLEREEISYMLTGSVAMSVYAEPRMTRDIDIVVELAESDAARIAGLFSPDYYVPEEAIRPSIVSRGMFNLFSLAHLVKVDLIVRKDEAYRRHEFSRRVRHEVGGFSAWVASKEDLVLSKLVWAAAGDSTLQLRDVKRLLATGADAAYLRRWAPTLGVDALLDELQK